MIGLAGEDVERLCAMIGVPALERHRRQISERRVPAPWIVQRRLRTPTGPFFARFSIRIIRGLADKSACTRRSTSLMTFFSAARWKVRKRIDGWRSQPGCSIALDVLNRRP